MTLENGLIVGVTLILAVLTVGVLADAPTETGDGEDRPLDAEVLPLQPVEDSGGDSASMRALQRPVEFGGSGGAGRRLEEPLDDGPAPVTDPNPVPTPTPEAGRREHIVVEGDRLVDLADRYLGSEASWGRIVAANPGLRPERMRPGRRLVIPARTQKAAQPKAAARPTPASDGGRARLHVVARGEILGRIARRYYGTSKAWTRIRAADGARLRDPHRLLVGQRLLIP